eukprot:GGOE01032764.1.p2 GENE.GGOE01032764.1~~GGOE01032764.1.p2  ORF type:complete len:157 (+),score=4.14 GGOE01032764.1:727-1197(+)
MIIDFVFWARAPHAPQTIMPGPFPWDLLCNCNAAFFFRWSLQHSSSELPADPACPPFIPSLGLLPIGIALRSTASVPTMHPALCSFLAASGPFLTDLRLLLRSTGHTTYARAPARTPGRPAGRCPFVPSAAQQQSGMLRPFPALHARTTRPTVCIP